MPGQLILEGSYKRSTTETEEPLWSNINALPHVILFLGSSIATARAMLSVAELMPWRASHTTESLLLSLDARIAAAAAALDASSSLKRPRSEPEECLDPMFHCREAEAAVRSFALQPQPPGAAPDDEAAVHAAVPVPAEVYLQLMAVQDAAGLPLEAVRVALQVMAGELPLQSEGEDAATAVGLQDIAVRAMRLANGAGVYQATVLVFLEALSRGGGVVNGSVVVELVSALGSLGRGALVAPPQ